jgi:hypothetical protein
LAVGRRAAHLVSYRIARKVNDPKYVGTVRKKPMEPPFQYRRKKFENCGSVKPPG